MGMKTTHVEFVQGDGEANGNEAILTLILYRAMSVERKATHVEFVQGDGNGNEDYSR